MTTDALSHAVRIMDIRPTFAGALSAGGSWAVEFDAPQGIKFLAIGQGSCFFSARNETPVLLRQGDVYLIREPKPFRLSSEPDRKPIHATRVFAEASGGIARVGVDQDVLVLGSHLEIGSQGAKLLFAALPPSLHLSSKGENSSRIPWLISEFIRESAANAPGGEIARSHLMQLIFLEITRSFQASAGNLQPGWLRAIFDPRIGPVVNAMHTQPERPWKLNDLAATAAMSRTAFTSRFLEIAGVSPMVYLTDWRMKQAAALLRAEDVSLSEVALSAGYKSEAAFSTAFKRVMGRSPMRHRRSNR